ncbi:MAG: methyltransferase domain-containing protein [bacterium]
MSSAHKEYFNRLAEEWDDTMKPDPALKEYMKKINLKSGDRVLDVGAGTGRLTAYLSEIVGAEGMVICEDIAENMLRKAKSKIKNPNTNFVCDDASFLALRDNFADSVVLFSIFPHLKKPLRALKEIRRVLKPGGTFLVLHIECSATLNRFHKELNTIVSEDVLPPADKLAAMAVSAGLKIIKAYEQDDLYWVEGRK